MAVALNRMVVFTNVQTRTVSNRKPEVMGVSNVSEAPPDIADALKRLEDISSLKSDWDSYGGEPPAPVALRAARNFIVILNRQNKVAPYFIGPIADGGIQMEWQRGACALEVEIVPDGGSFNYLKILGKGTPARKAEEKHNVSVDQVLAQVDSVIGE